MMSVPNCDKETQRICILSLSVSQIGGLVFALVFCIKGMFTIYTDASWVSLIINTAIIFSVGYYYISTWYVEEKLIFSLRNLKYGLNWVEWFIRFLAFVFLLFATFIMAFDEPNKLFNISWILFTMFALYLLWDLIVLIGSCKSIDKEVIKLRKKEIVPFFTTDLLGLISTIILVIISHTSLQELTTETAQAIGFLAAISCLLLLSPFIFCSTIKWVWQLVRNFSSRDTLR